MQQILRHKMCGQDAPWLGNGFSDWEASTGTRWAGQVFTLHLHAPASNAPYACQLSMRCWIPAANAPSGAADVYINRVRVDRVEDAYEKARRGDEMLVSFWTFGGKIETTFVFERALPPLNAADRRQLSVVVLEFSLKSAR